MDRTLRQRRLFRDNGHALVVAMDHARVYRTVTGLKDANGIIAAVMGAGADAILAPYGTAVGSTDVIGNGGMWLSVDTTPETVGQIVERALRLGADGIKVEVYPWSDNKETILNSVCMAAECRKWGLPLLVEAVPFGWQGADKRTPETIAASCRVASEAGADYVKAFYTGDQKSFRLLVDNCPVPVLILGGPKAESDRDVLVMVRDAMDAGAVGIAMGRNIWGHDNIAGITAALAAIIHDDASVDAACELIG